MKIRFLIIGICVFCIQIAKAQIDVEGAIELGLGFAAIPRIDKYDDGIRERKSTSMPLPGPVLGYHGILSIRTRISFQIGLQYQLAGVRDHSHTEGWFPTSLEYTHDVWEKKTFHKVGLPMKLRYNFKIFALAVNFGAGFRSNLFLSGQDYYYSVHDAKNDTEDRVRKKLFNPIRSGNPIKKFNNQVFVSFGLDLSDRSMIQISYNQGNILLYSEYEPSGWEFSYSRFENSDLTISLIRSLRKEQRFSGNIGIN